MFEIILALHLLLGEPLRETELFQLQRRGRRSKAYDSALEEDVSVCGSVCGADEAFQDGG